MIYIMPEFIYDNLDLLTLHIDDLQKTKEEYKYLKKKKIIVVGNRP